MQADAMTLIRSDDLKFKNNTSLDRHAMQIYQTGFYSIIYIDQRDKTCFPIHHNYTLTLPHKSILSQRAKICFALHFLKLNWAILKFCTNFFFFTDSL